MFHKFMCWCPDYNEESDAKEIENIDPYLAAEQYADSIHDSLDYPDEMEIHVKDADGKVLVLDVFVRMQPIFTARKRRGARTSRF